MANAPHNRRRFLNDDKTAIVDEDDPTAAFLLAAAGDAIPEEFVDLPYKGNTRGGDKQAGKADNK